MTPAPSDPTLAALHEAAARNPAMCGIFADYLDENGHPEAAALARFGDIARAIGAARQGPVHRAYRDHCKAIGAFLASSGRTPDRYEVSIEPEPNWWIGYRDGVDGRSFRPWRKGALAVTARIYRKPNSPSPTPPGT